MKRKHTALDVGLAAAETIARRMPVLWWGMVAPTSKSNSEIVGMVAEKQLAAAQGLIAAQAEMMKLAMTPWWKWGKVSPERAANRVIEAATGPATRRVKANAKRLRRR